MINRNVKTRIICFALCLLLLIPSVISFVVLADNNSGAPAQTEREEGSGIIVSMGDSFSAGEGITPLLGQYDSPSKKVTNPDWLAHRSTLSWPSRLELDGKRMVRGDNWYFVAASGAETVHINGGESDEKNSEKKRKEEEGYFPKDYNYEGLKGTAYLDPQIKIFEQLKNEGKEAEYVTITMGGNDADFGGVITTSLIASIADPGVIGLHDVNLVNMKLAAVWRDFYKEGGIRDKLKQSYIDISTAAGEQAKIIVVGYPELINELDLNSSFSISVAIAVNKSVRRFNDEIEKLVNECKAEGMKICFVSVEDGFKEHKAYSKKPYINSVDLLKQDENLKWEVASAYSMHPNDQGAQIYADCVNDKIAALEEDEGASEWPEATRSEELEIVLVLDTSGSMDGTPLNETKKAAKDFISTVVGESGASLGIVNYDTKAFKLSDFTRNQIALKSIVDNMHTGGVTNIQDGLRIAAEMLRESTAKRKMIVLMSDGLPNEGFTGDRLVQYADQIKREDVYIYALGFFQNVGYGSSSAERLMSQIASEGSYFNVDMAENLKYFFGDISDQINGTKYIYVRIACPVDVTVEYNGQVLSSVGAKVSQRTDFGTLTFEDNPNGNSYSSDNRIKVLRLKEGEAYDVKIEGNGTGQMEYTIGFMNENGEYDDLREFEAIDITENTVIDTVAEYTKTSVLNVDNDGDGDYDKKYKVSGKTRSDSDDDEEDALNRKAKKLKNTVVIICVITAGVTFVIFLIVVIRILVIKHANKKLEKTLAAEASAEASAEAPAEVPAEAPAEVPAEAPAEVPAEAPAETPAEAPAETPAEASAEAPAEASAEAPDEAPAETPAETSEETNQ